MHVLCDFHVLLELSYTFEHIWTNLLTQCTQLPVLVFCCFCISCFPCIKSAPKISENYIKDQRPGSLRNHQGRSGEGTTGTPEGSLARPHPRPRQEAFW